MDKLDYIINAIESSFKNYIKFSEKIELKKLPSWPPDLSILKLDLHGIYGKLVNIMSYLPLIDSNMFDSINSNFYTKF